MFGCARGKDGGAAKRQKICSETAEKHIGLSVPRGQPVCFSVVSASSAG